MAVLVCSCGQRLNATGAVPGRVGRCPACGAVLRVPTGRPIASSANAHLTSSSETGAEDAPAGYTLRPDATVPTTESHAAPRAPQARATRGAGARARGLIRGPRRPETRARDSLLYPLWDAGGLSLLACAPPILGLTSIFSFGLRDYVLGDNEVLAMGALTMVFPMLLLFVLAMGYTMRYLEAVLESSASGEVGHPRWPPWEFFEVIGGLVRWLAAMAPGLAVGTALALTCQAMLRGDLDHLGNQVALAALLGAGALFWPLPLGAVLLHNDLKAASPTTILSAVRRTGVGALWLGLLFGATAAVLLGIAPLLFALPRLGLLATVVGVWLYWAVSCYLMLVLTRILGRFYRRHAQALGWFPERARWGA